MAFSLDMAIVILVSVGALILFVREILTADVIALLVVAALLLSGVVEPKHALAGFSNPAVHTVAAMFVISAGLIKTGIVNSLGGQLIRLGGKNRSLVFLITLVVVVILSAFVNNTPIVMMMIPVALGLSKTHDLPVSKFLIPVSYASICGGVCTLIGTSTNLVVSGLGVEAGLEPLGMFEMAPVGIVLAVAGIAYLGTFGRWLLPERQTVTSDATGGRMREYVTEIIVGEGSALIGRSLEETVFRRRKDLKILQVFRGEEIFWSPFARPLEKGDILIVKGPASDILAISRQSGVELVPDIEGDSLVFDEHSHTLAELVVTPGSRFEGATVREVGFHRHFQVAVIGLERHGRHSPREKIVDTSLRVGDVILIQGEAAAVARMRNEEGTILLEGVESTVVHGHRAPIALAIAISVIAAATFTGVPIVACALAGALLMVMTRCLSVRDLYRVIDIHTLVLIAGMIGLGQAAIETGTAPWAAQQVLAVIRPLGPFGVLAAIYLITNIITEFLSNVAAAVLMVPLALSTAQEMGLSERPFLIAVAFAASAAFSTPMGYQTNTIVYGPGGYRFGDFTRVGAPLNILFFVLATALIPLFWPF